MELTEGCVEAMDGIAALLRGELAADAVARLRAHVAVCARCRAAHADAAACAPYLRAARDPDPGAAATGGPRDPARWERSLFLRLLAAERQDAGGQEPAGRRPVWARLAVWLGAGAPIAAEGEWSRWRHGPWPGASPR